MSDFKIVNLVSFIFIYFYFYFYFYLFYFLFIFFNLDLVRSSNITLCITVTYITKYDKDVTTITGLSHI